MMQSRQSVLWDDVANRDRGSGVSVCEDRYRSPGFKSRNGHRHSGSKRPAVIGPNFVFVRWLRRSDGEERDVFTGMESRAQKLDRIDIFRSDHAVVAIYNLGSEDLAIDDLQTRRIWRCRRPDRTLWPDFALFTLRANWPTQPNIAPITFGSGIAFFASWPGQALRSDRTCVALRALRARFASGPLGTLRSGSTSIAFHTLCTFRPSQSGFTTRTDRSLRPSFARIAFQALGTRFALEPDLSNGARRTHGTGWPRFALGTGASERQSKERKNAEEREGRGTTDVLSEV